VNIDGNKKKIVQRKGKNIKCCEYIYNHIVFHSVSTQSVEVEKMHFSDFLALQSHLRHIGVEINATREKQTTTFRVQNIQISHTCMHVILARQ
jgi:hypothetical protein